MGNIEAAWRGEEKTLTLEQASQDWDWDTGMPTTEFVRHFLSKFRKSETLGVLLDYDGADLRCFGTQSLRGDASINASVTILGGPKGISDPFKAMIRDAFDASGIPLVTVCLGPQQQMAHA